MQSQSPLLFGSAHRRKNHPWIRLDERAGGHSSRLMADYQRHKQTTAGQRDPPITNTDHPFLAEQEPGVIPQHPKVGRGTNRHHHHNNNTGTTFQQYRQQQRVRKHPWRTDVKRRGRTSSSWKHLVKSTAPWDESMHIIHEEDDDEDFVIARTASHESHGREHSNEPATDEQQPQPHGGDGSSHNPIRLHAVGETDDDDDDDEIVRPPNQPTTNNNDTLATTITPTTTNNNSKTHDTPQDRLMDSLRTRVAQVYQGDHVIVTGTGQGLGKQVVSAQAQAEQEHAQRVRQQLVRALQERLRHYYTGHITEVGEEKKREDYDDDENDDEDDESVVSVDESVVSVQSMIVAATLLHAVKPPESHKEALPSLEQSSPPARHNSVQKNSNETEWEEYTVRSHEEEEEEEWEEETLATTLSRQQGLSLLAELSFGQEPPPPPPPEEEEWEEETVATEALSRGQQIKLLQASVPEIPALRPKEAAAVDDEPEWDEYTVETEALPSTRHTSANSEPEWDEYTVETIADALLALPNALHGLQGAVAPPPPAMAPPEMIRQESSETNKSPGTIAATVKHIVKDSNNRLKQYDLEEESFVDEIIEEEYDDDHWDDYTVETVADAFASLPRTLQLEFLRNTSSRGVTSAAPPPQNAQADEDEESEGSSVPPEGAYADANAGKDDEWTEVTCRETIKDIPRILQQADASKPFTSPQKNAGLEPFGTDPTLSSTDSDSENWHDARSAESGDPAVLKEVASSSGSTGDRSRGSQSQKRRSRFPPTNLNQILKKDMFSKDLSVVEGALRTLTEKADEDLEYRAHIVRSGGILAIVRAMQQNVYNANVQLLACHTLGKIATDPENRVAIGEVGGVEAVVGAMSEHMAEEPVAEATCSALWILTSDSSQNQMCVETAALGVIVSCMRRYAKNVVVQEKAFQTLANLCLRDEEKLVTLSQMGGFVVMSTALVLHWENQTVKNEAISTLSQLFQSLAVSQNA